MKIFNFFPKVLALIAVLLLVLRSVMIADASWDTLSYHLSFSAMRVGLLSHDNFILTKPLLASYYGFPSAIYYLKGFLWSVTGKAESAQLVSILSVVIFVLFAKKTLRIPVEWLAIGVLSIPTIQIGASSNMTDVPANMGMAMVFLSLYKLITQPTQITKTDFLWLLIACLITSGSKPQAVVIGGILFAVYVTTFFLLRTGGTIKYSELLTKKMAVLWLVVCAVAISYPALINIYSYGNPMYPMDLNIGSVHLKGVFNASNWNDTEYLKSLPQQTKWLLSVLEFHAFDFRPLAYTVGQGDVPLESKSFRTGGYFSPLILMSLFVIVLLAIKSVRYEYVRGLLLLVCLTVLVASLPGSNELRYYSFWAISIVAIAIDQLESNKDDLQLKGIFLAYKAFLVISFIFVAFITGGEYFKWQGSSYAELANSFPRGKVINTNGSTTTYCYEFGADFRMAIFDSAVFSNPNNIVITGGAHEICKRGAM